jgi:hypothetical protein
MPGEGVAMLDYILFNEKPFDLFISWLKANNVSYETKIDEESYVIQVPENLEEDLLDAIDDKYEEFMDMNQDIVNEEEKQNHDGYNMAGIIVTLKDGTTSYADIDSDLLNKIVSVITPQEFGVVVDAIADAVENPQPKTYCQRMREGEIV